MRKFFVLFFLFLIPLTKALGTPDLIVFGDSLSDTGAGYAICKTIGVTPIPPSPYYEGRYCNGPGWVDYVTQNLPLSYINFAVGGAQTGTGQTLDSFGYKMGGLFDQIDRFAATIDQKIDQNTTIVITIGSNDFLSLLLTPSQLTKEGIIRRSKQAITNIATACHRLKSLGAATIVLWNVPDIGKTPKFNEGPPLNALAPVMSAATGQFNILLADFVRNWNVSQEVPKLVYYDADRTLREIANEFEAEGVDLTAHTLTVSFHSIPPKIQVSGPENSALFFYDQHHPTTLVWQRFADYFQNFLLSIANSKAEIFD